MVYEEENLNIEENENEGIESTSENGESNSEYYSPSSPTGSGCTYVYNENLELICLEEVINNTSENNEEENSENIEEENINEIENNEENNSENEETIDYSKELYDSFIEFRSDFDSFIDIYNDFTLSITDLIGVIVVLYLISLLLSSFNTWRRSNR